MNFPKHLLPMPAGSLHTSSRPLLLHSLDVLERIKLRHPDQFTNCVTISVRDQSQRVEVQSLLENTPASLGLMYETVIDAVADAGPTQGLLAAHKIDETAHWLVVGCDYPLLGPDALDQLVVAHNTSKKAITCFQNSQGFAEPLLSIWSCSSLSMLANLANDVSPSVGPNQVIKTLQHGRPGYDTADRQDYGHGVALVRSLDANWIKSVDTRDQWEAAKAMVQPVA